MSTTDVIFCDDDKGVYVLVIEIKKSHTAASILSLCGEGAHFIRGFGSSDCRCSSHLIHIPGQEGAWPQLQKSLEFEKADIHGNQS